MHQIQYVPNRNHLFSLHRNMPCFRIPWISVRHHHPETATSDHSLSLDNSTSLIGLAASVYLLPNRSWIWESSSIPKLITAHENYWNSLLVSFFFSTHPPLLGQSSLSKMHIQPYHLLLNPPAPSVLQNRVQTPSALVYKPLLLRPGLASQVFSFIVTTMRNSLGV